MRRIIQVGDKYGKLTVTKLNPGTRKVTCKCECGKVKDIHKNGLLTGKTKSCGCGRGRSFEKEKKPRSNNTSGVTGVAWHINAKKWVASIFVNGRQLHLGSYQNIGDAIRARLNAENKYYEPLLRGDITGRRFGKLVALKELEERVRKAIAWECKCDCGKTVKIPKYELVKGKRTSCGCSKKESPKNVNDLTGKKFGKLTVLRRAGTTKQGNALWECDCDCGNHATVISTLLLNGNTKSCGCAAVEHIKHARDVLDRDMRIDGIVVPKLTQKVRSDSQTGHKGVTRRIKRNREYYEVNITVDGKRKYVGSSADLDAAIRMRQDAEEKYYKPIIEKLEERKNESK